METVAPSLEVISDDRANSHGVTGDLIRSPQEKFLALESISQRADPNLELGLVTHCRLYIASSDCSIHSIE